MPALSAAWMIIEPLGAAISTPSMKTVTWSGGRFGLTGCALMPGLLSEPGTGNGEMGIGRTLHPSPCRTHPPSCSRREAKQGPEAIQVLRPFPIPDFRFPASRRHRLRHHGARQLVVDQESPVDDRVLELVPEMPQETLHRPGGRFA